MLLNSVSPRSATVRSEIIAACIILSSKGVSASPLTPPFQVLDSCSMSVLLCTSYFGNQQHSADARQARVRRGNQPQTTTSTQKKSEH
jgi:hypothetical protein